MNTREEVTKSRKTLNRAIQIDRDCIRAYHTMIVAIRDYAIGELAADDVWPEIMTHALEILKLDDTSFEAQYWLAFYKLSYEWNWQEAKQVFERLIRWHPEDHISWAVYYLTIGRTNESRLEQRKLEAEDPTDWLHRLYVAIGAFAEGRYDDGIREGHRADALDAKQYGQHCFAAQCAIAKKDFRLALEEIRKTRDLFNAPEFLALEGYTYALMGEREKAADTLRELERQKSNRYVQPYFVARVHAALGNRAEALTYLERAFDKKAEALVNPHFGGGGLRRDPAWDGLRDEPRFQALLKKIGLDVWPK